MNIIQKFYAWLTAPAAAQEPATSSTPAASQPTLGDQLLQLAGAWVKSRNPPPADNGPGATTQKSEAPVGQTLADLLTAHGQG